MTEPVAVRFAPSSILVAALLHGAATAQLGGWADLGGGVAGTAGTPVLDASPAQYGRMLCLHASDVAPFTLSLCVVGTSRIDAPVFAGVVVPEPVVVLDATPNGTTDREYRLLLPDVCLQAPVELYAQVLVFDLGAPQSWAFSNAITATVRDNVPSDFNGDGYSDLAVGVPLEDVQGVANAGAVNVVYGSAAGLTTTGNEVLRPGKSVNGLLQGGPVAYASWGTRLATGDFNGDGFDDLAVGAPDEDVAWTAGTLSRVGSVHVIYGSASGLQGGGAGPDDQRFTQGFFSGEFFGPFEFFGDALCAGDVDGDGFDDLLVGTPGQDGSQAATGAVHLAYGSAQGLVSGETYDNPSLSADPGDYFGEAVLLADLDGDGRDEIVVGVPEDSYGVYTQAGSVWIYDEDRQGNLSIQAIYRNTTGNAQSGAFFGHALAAGDFSRDGAEDLVVGVPQDSAGGHYGAGSVDLLRFGPGSILPLAASTWNQATPGVQGTANSLELFGWSLAVCDYDQDGLPDLAVGTPSERLFGQVISGAVHVLRGSASQGLTATNDVMLTYPGMGLGAVVGFESCGYALTAGRFAGGCDDHLVIGIPGATVNGIDTGAVAVIRSGAAATQWSQGPLSGQLNVGDWFGGGLAGSPR